jgi:hypothetical protein
MDTMDTITYKRDQNPREVLEQARAKDPDKHFIVMPEGLFQDWPGCRRKQRRLALVDRKTDKPLDGAID